MKLWIDDVREAPHGYDWCKSVNETIETIKLIRSITAYWPSTGEVRKVDIEVIDIDHDAGDYASDGGDYIKILDWLEENNYNYPIHIHSMNPVGISNMRAIIQKNNWKEV